MNNTDLKTRLQEDMKTAMKAREKQRLGTIRLILAAIKQKQIDDQVDLDDAAIITLLDKMLKQRRDALEQFQSAGRTDLAEQEAFEINVITTYLPEQLSESELAKIIADAIKQTNASSAKDMGKVMGVVKPKVQGRTDMRQVSEKIKTLLS